MRHVLVGLIGSLWLVMLAGCGPTVHHGSDDWDDPKVARPEITGNNDMDEARWRRELASDPWGEDAHLLTDDPPKTAEEYEQMTAGPQEVGPPAPLTGWESFKQGAGKFGKAMFSVFTVLATLGMMAAPYLLMM